MSLNITTDTGAQSCLCSLKDFLRCGFKHSDLLPVKRTILAANREQIDITGALFLKLSGKDSAGMFTLLLLWSMLAHARLSFIFLEMR